ncbi:Y-family DNA polymerase [Flavobacterium sp. '19STA2R22 D10 B1']|uniref:Y-family DNA polymerase n=1 Tax=Flavobacterium aerium TaxID=3037261 RepID=UPI00278BE9C8|nr:Y-family DNA polymerase [Flavobacterium sp. '19STA2R22 D10 B1']
MYALVDCNNFYASCERVFQPQWQNKPIVILSNNDGCVISRSEEAKAVGVPMGAPAFKIKELVQQHQIKVFSSNYPLYGDLSKRVMDILRQFTNHIEVYSIDEAFLNFDDVKVEDYNEYGQQMRIRILKWISIPICIGFAPTKALSKVANKIAKKFPNQTNGVYCIDTEEKRIKALKWTKIEDVWGIGYRMTKKLKARNILTALDFIAPEQETWIKREMGITGLRLKYELEGKPILELDIIPEPKKSIATTRSFKGKITAYDELKERVSTFAVVCAEKLRKQESCCHSIIVMLMADRYNTTSKRYYFSQLNTLTFASNSNITISNAAIKILRELYVEGVEYKKAGVIVTELIHQNEKQLHLFEEENPKHLALMKTIDALHHKIGKTKIKLGSQDLQHTWKMRQDKLSPKYTTDFTEILEIQCH